MKSRPFTYKYSVLLLQCHILPPWIIKKLEIKHPGLTTSRVVYEVTLKNKKLCRCVFTDKDTGPSTCTCSHQYYGCRYSVGQAVFFYTLSKQDGKFLWFGCFVQCLLKIFWLVSHHDFPDLAYYHLLPPSLKFWTICIILWSEWITIITLCSSSPKSSSDCV